MKGRNEVSFYPEIMAYVKEIIESNFRAAKNPLRVYCKSGELRKGLHQIISENEIKTKSIIDFAASTPPLSLDIFALITDGEKYELLIMEIKLVKAMGLSELSQLIGYCIVSNAQYGLLINVDNGVSPRLQDLLVNEKNVTDIVRNVQTRNMMSTIEHCLGVMEWDSVTKSLNYTGHGKIRTMSELCKMLAARFE